MCRKNIWFFYSYSPPKLLEYFSFASPHKIWYSVMTVAHDLTQSAVYYMVYEMRGYTPGRLWKSGKLRGNKFAPCIREFNLRTWWVSQRYILFYYPYSVRKCRLHFSYGIEIHIRVQQRQHDGGHFVSSLKTPMLAWNVSCWGYWKPRRFLYVYVGNLGFYRR